MFNKSHCVKTFITSLMSLTVACGVFPEKNSSRKDPSSKEHPSILGEWQAAYAVDEEGQRIEVDNNVSLALRVTNLTSIVIELSCVQGGRHTKKAEVEGMSLSLVV